MEYRAEKQRLYRSLVVNGTRPSEFSSIAKKEGVAAPDELISRWEARFYENSMADYPTEPRLINRFMLGADPEFVFAVGGKYKHAESLRLNTLDAFGCDMSGRQAELRAHPSRFVLEVVASLIDTVRWMNQFHHLSGFQWLAPAHFVNDGVGGHVHFGRKRPDLNKGIENLDCVTQLLLDARVLDLEGQQARRSGQGRYGAWGDWRAQTHGYEYRTMPSWMTSPWAAYFTLVVSKLAVLDDVKELLANKRPVETLTNLLRAYKSRDDDARIALMALEKHGFPVYLPDDFKARWGVGAHVVEGPTHNSHFAPPIISPTAVTCRELFDYLVSKKPLPLTLPAPNWTPFAYPAGVSKVTVPPHVMGVSDVAQGLLAMKGIGVGIYRNDRNTLRLMSSVSLPFLNAQYIEAAKKYPELAEYPIVFDRLPAAGSSHYQIHVPRDIHDDHAHTTNKDLRTALRGYLTKSGLFPIVKYTDVGKPLEEALVVKKKRPKVIGRVVSSICGGIEVDGNIEEVRGLNHP